MSGIERIIDFSQGPAYVRSEGGLLSVEDDQKRVTTVPYRQRIREALPAEGQVRLLSVTEKQFGKQEVYMGRKRSATEAAGGQFLLF